VTVRLQKFLSEAGVASRREGEKLILSGKIAVDGQVVRLLGTKVDPAKNEVTLNGKPVQAKAKRFVALNKPPKIICTRRDTHDRATVFDLLPSDWGHLYTIGRLDADSEGLILLTNDGDFCQKVAHPRHGMLKTYRVSLARRVAPESLKTLTNGLRDDGEWLQAKSAKLLAANNTRSEVELVLAGEKPGDPQDVQSAWPSGVAVAAHRGRASETGRAAARQMARPEPGRNRRLPALRR